MKNIQFEPNRFKPYTIGYIALKVLYKLLQQIEYNNVHNDSFVKNQLNSTQIFIKHRYDNLRMIDILIKENFVKITFCFMKDSMSYQLNNRKVDNLECFLHNYFYAIFEGNFSKNIYYKNKKIFYVWLKFNNYKIKNRLYSSFFNLIKIYIFKISPDRKEIFCYISFFKKQKTQIQNKFL